MEKSKPSFFIDSLDNSETSSIIMKLSNSDYPNCKQQSPSRNFDQPQETNLLASYETIRRAIIQQRQAPRFEDYYQQVYNNFNNKSSDEEQSFGNHQSENGPLAKLKYRSLGSPSVQSDQVQSPSRFPGETGEDSFLMPLSMKIQKQEQVLRQKNGQNVSITMLQKLSCIDEVSESEERISKGIKSGASLNHSLLKESYQLEMSRIMDYYRNQLCKLDVQTKNIENRKETSIFQADLQMLRIVPPDQEESDSIGRQVSPSFNQDHLKTLEDQIQGIGLSKNSSKKAERLNGTIDSRSIDSHEERVSSLIQRSSRKSCLLDFSKRSSCQSRQSTPQKSNMKRSTEISQAKQSKASHSYDPKEIEELKQHCVSLEIENCRLIQRVNQLSADGKQSRTNSHDSVKQTESIYRMGNASKVENMEKTVNQIVKQQQLQNFLNKVSARMTDLEQEKKQLALQVQQLLRSEQITTKNKKELESITKFKNSIEDKLKNCILQNRLLKQQLQYQQIDFSERLLQTINEKKALKQKEIQYIKEEYDTVIKEALETLLKKTAQHSSELASKDSEILELKKALQEKTQSQRELAKQLKLSRESVIELSKRLEKPKILRQKIEVKEQKQTQSPVYGCDPRHLNEEARIRNNAPNYSPSKRPSTYYSGEKVFAKNYSQQRFSIPVSSQRPKFLVDSRQVGNVGPKRTKLVNFNNCVSMLNFSTQHVNQSFNQQNQNSREMKSTSIRNCVSNFYIQRPNERSSSANQYSQLFSTRK